MTDGMTCHDSPNRSSSQPHLDGLPPSASASTCAALRAVGVSLLIELTAGLLAAGTWLLGAILV